LHPPAMAEALAKRQPLASLSSVFDERAALDMVNGSLTTFVGSRETAAGVSAMSWTVPSSTAAWRFETHRT
jgi:hypothetical protein